MRQKLSRSLKAYFERLSEFVSRVRDRKRSNSGNTYFHAFNFCPYNSVKVFVIGQDPYQGPVSGPWSVFFSDGYSSFLPVLSS
jgi:uracil DNA glycosylase